jgi:acetyl esterase/lipase
MKIYPFFLLLFLMAGCVPPLPKTVTVQRNIEYGQANGQPLRLDLYTPINPVGKLPVIVWLFGGGWKNGSKTHCPIAIMATQNLAIVSVDYQLSETSVFPAQLYDCKGAIRWLRANAKKYNLDPNHIGVFGVSAGGHLALLLATTADDRNLEGDVGDNLGFSSRVQCVCALYPPTDLNRLVTDPKTRESSKGDVARLIGGPVADNVAKANAASPITYVNKNTTPVFLMHGGSDNLVPPEQSVLFYGAALKAGVEAHLEIIPGKGHGIIPPPRVAQEIFQFFREHLAR